MKYLIFVVLISTVMAKDDIFEDIVKILLNKLDSALEDTFTDEARKELDESIRKATTTAQDEYDKAIVKIQLIQKESLKKLSAMKEKAAIKKRNIDICLAGNEMKLMNLVNGRLGSLTSCLEKEIDNAYSLEHSALRKISRVVGKIRSLQNEVNNCGKSLLKPDCIKHLFKSVTNIIAAPLKVKADVIKTAADIKKLTKKMEKCGLVAVTWIPTEAAAEVAKISICVTAKLLL